MVIMVSFVINLLSFLYKVKASITLSATHFDKSRFWFEQDVGLFIYQLPLNVITLFNLSSSSVRLRLYVALYIVLITIIPISYIW